MFQALGLMVGQDEWMPGPGTGWGPEARGWGQFKAPECGVCLGHRFEGSPGGWGGIPVPREWRRASGLGGVAGPGNRRVLPPGAEGLQGPRAEGPGVWG